MKKLVQVTEVDNEGLEALLGKNVLVFCLNYIYTGELEGVNKTCILLNNPKIVYDTGAFDVSKFSDAQALPNKLYVSTTCIESFHETNKK